jgi:hypothetical protein
MEGSGSDLPLSSRDEEETLTATNSRFTLHDALELLRVKCIDYYKRYLSIFKSMEKDVSRCSFDGYVEAIVNDPLEWLQSFPLTDVSEPALAKSKSAMLFLLSHETIRSQLTPAVCEHAVDVLTSAWQANKRMLVEQRGKLKNNNFTNFNNFNFNNQKVMITESKTPTGAEDYADVEDITTMVNEEDLDEDDGFDDENDFVEREDADDDDDDDYEASDDDDDMVHRIAIELEEKERQLASALEKLETLKELFVDVIRDLDEVTTTTTTTTTTKPKMSKYVSVLLSQW